MRRGNYILLQIELDLIKNFLDHVVEEAAVEYETIQQKAENGEISSFEQFDYESGYPIARQEMASRTVYYEINALIENELRESASEPWWESKKHRGPKTLKELDKNKPFSEAIKSLKSINDIGLKDLISLIEEKYDIIVKDLDGADVLFEIREAVNAFKHRQGFRRIQEQWAEGKLGERYQADVGKAYNALEKAHKFIVALWKATNRSPISKEIDFNEPDEINDDAA